MAENRDGIGHTRRPPGLGWHVCSLLVATLIGVAAAARPGVSRASPPPPQAECRSPDAFQTALDYVTTFYPLWFTYNQSRLATPNQLVGPESVTPLYQVVVAINVDTLYASSYLDLSKQPAILTIPPTEAVFSVLILDPYGNVFNAPQKFQAGLYALVGPGGSQGQLPPGATVVQLPVNYPTIIFRADKYASDGTNTTSQADTFRRSLRLQPLSQYGTNNNGQTQIKGILSFALPFKTIADNEVKSLPVAFLRQLSSAVASPRTPPLSPADSALVSRFEACLNGGGSRQDLAAGAQAAHRLILENYLGNRDADNWINFTDIGHWGTNVLDRSGITEFIQYANDHAAAAYYHVFLDGAGKALDGRTAGGYVIDFPAGQPPQAQRFWSITVYTPEAIELVPNRLSKYNVASYTPGLQHNKDGSLTLYFATIKPLGVPATNYVPVPPRRFNIMLRFYGPEGEVANGTYTPPPVLPAR